MTSVPSRAMRSKILAATFTVLAAVWLTGCPDRHIGRPCDIGVMNPGVATEISVNPQALECPSRVCIWPAQAKSTDTRAFCTDECAGDDDCAEGEKRGSDPTDKRCQSGFACRYYLPKLETNPYACKRVCVCKDFLVSGDPDVEPPSCK